MGSLLAKSFGRHLKWWITSFLPAQRDIAPLSTRRIVFLLLGFPLFVLAQACHALCLVIDELFFSKYRGIDVKEPVFVLGIPRSGTTFLHRSLAEDTKRYTSFSTWEAILAPSIIERKVLHGLASIDRSIGSPLRRLADKLLDSSAGDFNDIHAVGLSAAEEDYLSLLPVGGCFILIMAFPFAHELQQLAQLDRMGNKKRDQLVTFYKRMLQRHLYCHPGKQLLSKNAAFASWGMALKNEFPDGRFLVCVREPVSALSSQLSSLAPARDAFGTDPTGKVTNKMFFNFYAHFYESLSEFVSSAPKEEIALIAQADLKADSQGTIRAAIQQLGLTAQLNEEEAAPRKTSPHKSEHRHKPEDFSLDSETIHRSMHHHFEAMMRGENRVDPTQP